MSKIEEKAKAYDEAIERARKIKNGEPINVPDGTTIPDAIFPELKKDEGDMIRKHLISLFEKFVTLGVANECETSEIKVDDILAWLEKKGEQKPILDVEIPFGAKDSELKEVTYDIPKGYHAEIDGNKVVIKQGEQKPAE